ncbi:hypothetical protein KCP71_07445 [Salmonella enterica subsp. enterica]|nr:hypothetical protein KCP71_07445 [Salmonella enterica subsp. enterica]
MAECLNINGPVFTLWPAAGQPALVTTTGGNAAACVATAGDKPGHRRYACANRAADDRESELWLVPSMPRKKKRKTVTFHTARLSA